MSKLVLTNATIVGDPKPQSLRIEKNIIAQITSEKVAFDSTTEVIDATGLTILPGFIDLHTHGAVGHDVMDASIESMTALSAFYATGGVTSFLGATITAAKADIDNVITTASDCLKQQLPGAQLLGIHLEGPYLNQSAAGAQPKSQIRQADASEYAGWIDSKAVKMVTLSPQSRANLNLISYCKKNQVIVSIGHTTASPEEVEQAVAAGATQATHTFNGMAGFHHRTLGTLGAVLTDDRLVCELIADGIHVHPRALVLALRAKGIENIILVTDSISATGMSDGEYRLGNQKVMLINGRVTVLGTDNLAGSSLTMDVALRNFIKATGLPLEKAWPVTSRNPARQLGLSATKGEVQVGYDADLVLLDKDLEVQYTIVGGSVVYKN